MLDSKRHGSKGSPTRAFDRLVMQQKAGGRLGKERCCLTYAQPNRGQEPANAHRSGMFCMKFFRNSDMASGSEKKRTVLQENG